MAIYFGPSLWRTCTRSFATLKKSVLRTGKAQISMYICVVCSWSSLFVNIFYSPHWFIKGKIPRLIWASLPAYEIKYSWLSLSRPRLSRMPAYLEVKIWSLFKHENLITGNKILWKRGEIVPKFLLFSTIFSIYLEIRGSNYIYIC